MKYKNLLLPALLLLCIAPLRAQQPTDEERDFHFQLHLGTSLTQAFGEARPLQWVAPSGSLRVSERLRVKGGVAMATSQLGDWMPTSLGKGRDLAPRREGTHTAALWLGMDYRISDRLTVWGSAAYLGGHATPFWSQEAMPVGAWIFSGGARYEWDDRFAISIHAHIVHDSEGSLLPAMTGIAPSFGYSMLNSGWWY